MFSDALQMEGGLLGLIRQQQPGIAADAICVLGSSMQPSRDAPPLLQTVSAGTSGPVVACAAAGGVVATASTSDLETGGAAICRPDLACPRAPMVPLAPAAARVDGCRLHVDISGRSAAAATQTRPPPPPMLFDDFSAWADGASGTAHPAAPDRRLPLLPPPSALRARLPLPPPPQQHAASSAPFAMADMTPGGVASSPGVKAQPPARSHQQPLLPSVAASRSRLHGSRLPSPSAASRRSQALPLHTCRICHRLIPGPPLTEQRCIVPSAAAAAGDGSSSGRSPAARSLEADVARALVSTLQRHPRPHSSSAVQMVRHENTTDNAAAKPPGYTKYHACTAWRQSFERYIVAMAFNMLHHAHGRLITTVHSGECRQQAHSCVHPALQPPAVVLSCRPSCVANMNGQQQRCSGMLCISTAPKSPLGRGTAKAAAARVTLVRQPSEPAAGTCAAAAVGAAGATVIRRSCGPCSTERRQCNTSGSSPGVGRRGSPRHRCRLPAGAMQAASSSHLHTRICSCTQSPDEVPVHKSGTLAVHLCMPYERLLTDGIAWMLNRRHRQNDLIDSPSRRGPTILRQRGASSTAGKRTQLESLEDPSHCVPLSYPLDTC